MAFSQHVISEQLKPAILSLLQASDYAHESGADRWQFAVDLNQLLTTGATLMDVRWLVHSRFADHAKETTVPGDPERTFRPLAPTAFPTDTYLVLTDAGAAQLRAALDSTIPVSQSPPRRLGEGRGEGASLGSKGSSPLPASHDLRERRNEDQTAISPSSHPPTPEWDASHRELRYQGQVIKHFRVPAKNQELILTAFQEDGWPHCIDDPLSPDREVDPKQRLQATIKSLNRNQLVRLIRFHGNGNGLQVYWEVIQDNASARRRRHCR